MCHKWDEPCLASPSTINQLAADELSTGDMCRAVISPPFLSVTVMAAGTPDMSRHRVEQYWLCEVTAQFWYQDSQRSGGGWGVGACLTIVCL